MAIKFVEDHKLGGETKNAELHHGDDVVACTCKKCPETGDLHICPDVGFGIDLPIGEDVTLKLTDGSGSEYHGIINEDKCLQTSR